MCASQTPGQTPSLIFTACATASAESSGRDPGCTWRSRGRRRTASRRLGTPVIGSSASGTSHRACPTRAARATPTRSAGSRTRVWEGSRVPLRQRDAPPLAERDAVGAHRSPPAHAFHAASRQSQDKSTDDDGVEPADDPVGVGLEAQELQPREPARVLGELTRDAEPCLQKTHDPVSYTHLTLPTTPYV